MRFLLAFAGLLVVIGAPLQVRAAQAGAPVTVMQDADPLSPLSPLDRTVTLALERVSLKAALDAVARQTGVRIAYSRRVVPLDRPVSVQLDAVRVEAALDTLLHGTGVAPTLDRSGQILLVSDGDGPSRRAHQTGSLAGTVRDAGSGAPLAAVSVTVVGTRLTGATQADGRYAISGVPPGTHRLRARLLGYTPGDTTVVVQDGHETVVDFGLRGSAIELNPVVAVGYANVRKSDLTGAVSSVSAEEFVTKAAPTVTLSSGLQGKAAGVHVIDNSGMPGEIGRAHV